MLGYGLLCPGHFFSEFDKVSCARENNKCISAKEIAKYTLKGVLKRKTKLIPGIQNKMLYVLRNIIPEGIFTSINYRIQKNKKANN